MLQSSRFLSGLALFAMTLGMGRAAVAVETSGTVAIQSTSIAAGVGVQWGDGSLKYNGKTYPFSLQGLNVIGIGYSEVKAEGAVTSLTKLEDFEGVYAAAEAGATAGSGTSTITMKNPHGVTISLHTIEEGAKLSLAAGGVNISLKK